MKMLIDMDSDFSFLAFLTVFISTVALFWNGYRITFYKNVRGGNLLLILSGLFFLCLLLLLVISGSASNEQANKVKILVQCLPYETGNNQQKINFFKKTLLQNNVLTLWKIYVMDRSLLICIFGTLLTYGMMLGSLGQEN
ncbi:uncharacterized protein TNCT_271101 [Trichonephila clavata]|uniref:Uncharacterized protein n=1 Tax=Trichonephila clavata TaxID=2740835 RepID=A0A8X6LWP9_TRICU|nr:uncharacterized protein TNCT_271101 [Trichonephila clavata]